MKTMKIGKIFLTLSMLSIFTFAFIAYRSDAATSSKAIPALRPALSEQRLKITLNETDVVYATMAKSHAADIFAQNLPFTIDMDDYINRNKRGPLPFVIQKEDLQNIIYPFEIGDIIYYPPGPLLGIFYEHNGAEISAGYELAAVLDAEGIQVFKKYPGDVKVTVELSK